MKVDVDETGQRAARQSTCEIAEGVRRRDRAQRSARRQLDDGGRGQRGPALARREVRRSHGTRRAVRDAELRARFRDPEVGEPTASAEERRREPELSEPRPLGQDPLTGRTARRPRVVGRRPVRVMTERPVCGSSAGAFDPCDLVLTEREVGRTHQGRNPESPGAPSLECREACPDGVVQRSLHVAGDDRVPFPRRGAHRGRS